MFKRRDFLKISSLSALPFVASKIPGVTGSVPELAYSKDAEAVYFINDGIFYRPEDFLLKLQEINKTTPIERDSYADGGTMQKLLQKCMEITGKEAAIYMSSGTLANQLAIQVLSGNNTKAFVQDTSHVYRDEGDAAQTLYNKRLIPLAKDKAHFTLEELQHAIAEHKAGEYFLGEVGTISIETPVRRCDNQAFPFSEMKRISEWCRTKGYKLHLDGARLHMSAIAEDVSIKDYSALFDTVYLCLYKYLGGTGGAVLCGDKTVIDQMHHLVKIHGGSIFTNWTSAAIALDHLNTIDADLKRAAQQASQLFDGFKELGFSVNTLENGTNQYNVSIPKGLDAAKFNTRLRAAHNIIFGMPREDGFVKIKVNPTLLRRENKKILEAFEEALAFASK